MEDINRVQKEFLKSIDFDYIFKTYLEKIIISNFEDTYTDFTKEDKQMYIDSYKKSIQKTIIEINSYLEDFKKSKAPIIAKDYERFFKNIIDKKEELQLYSSNLILLDKVPLHPNILFYLMVAKLKIYKIDNDEVFKIFYEQLLNKNNFKKPPYTKNTNVFFLNMFKNIIDNTTDKETIKEYARIWMSFYPSKS